ncbi:unnamed protein product [Chondrus crispus]|uniref:Uncharacterized protein n=1 Tax=Chondrus crispus TaxID=2769 RepID=R7Q367_CHOCR|nr:unnamed protein product [Chondrus crispus]CDF32972.1 unnamed protein product [Chondrus crispus]|eukprot:XP_005712775.1 unnamed protein product [Chondrus crispus]
MLSTPSSQAEQPTTPVPSLLLGRSLQITILGSPQRWPPSTRVVPIL